MKNAEVPLLDEEDFEVSSDLGRTIWTPERLLGALADPTAEQWFQGLSLIGRANYHSPSHVIPPEAFTRHYEVIFVEKGRQVHWLDGKRHVLKSGDCFLIQPLQKHSTAERAEERGRFYWWIFSPKEGFLGLDKGRSALLMQSLLSAFASPRKREGAESGSEESKANLENLENLESPESKAAKQKQSAGEAAGAVLRLEPTRAKQLKSLLQALFADWESGQGDIGFEQILYWEQSLLQVFFLMLPQFEPSEARPLKIPGAPKGRRVKAQRDADLYLEKVCHCITRNIRKEIDLQDLIALTPYSGSHLLRLFREVYGLPLRDYINGQKISHAQKLLLDGSSVTSIAAELNFSSSQYFAVSFRRYAGLSPTEWLLKNKSEPKG